RIGYDLFHFVDRKADIGDAAMILRQTTYIQLADLGHQWRVRWEIMLDAGDQVAARGENVRQKRVLGEFDGVAMVEDRDGQRDHTGTRLHFLVAPHGDIDSDRTVV